MKAVKIALVLFFIALISCNEVTNPGNNNSREINIDNETINGLKNSIASNTDDVIGTLEARYCFYGSNKYYSLSAHVFNNLNSKQWINVGKVTVSNITIDNPGSDNYYHTDVAINASNLPAFGAKGRFKIEGNSQYNIPAFDTTLYVPDKLNVSNITNGDLINRNQDLTINWNADSNNDYCYILLNYDRVLSNMRNNNLPADTVIYWTDKIDDDGSYTIPSSVWQKFPEGATIDFYLARGNGKIIEKNGKKFMLLGDVLVIFSVDLTD